MRTFLRILAIFYFLGCLLHVADLMDLRLKYSEMNTVWKGWIIFLMIADGAAAIALWLDKPVGIYLFFIVAGSQLFAYSIFHSTFGNQASLIVFHLLCIGIYFFLRARDRSSPAELPIGKKPGNE